MNLWHCLLYEYHIDAISKYTLRLRAERGVGCFCCHCHWYRCCDIFSFLQMTVIDFTSLHWEQDVLKPQVLPQWQSWCADFQVKGWKKSTSKKHLKNKEALRKKLAIKIELTCPSWGWAHSRQSCWWTRDSTWVIVQNSWGRKIVGSNVKMCDSCRRDYMQVQILRDKGTPPQGRVGEQATKRPE